MDNDPADMLFKEVGKVYRKGESVSGFALNELFDVTKIESRIQRNQLAQERIREEQEHLEQDVARILSLEEPPPELPAVQEVTNWEAEVQNGWYGFRDVLQKSGLTERVTIEAHVRNRTAQWIEMNQEKREF
jgi:hypothetical protein